MLSSWREPLPVPTVRDDAGSRPRATTWLLGAGWPLPLPVGGLAGTGGAGGPRGVPIGRGKGGGWCLPTPFPFAGMGLGAPYMAKSEDEQHFALCRNGWLAFLKIGRNWKRWCVSHVASTRLFFLTRAGEVAGQLSTSTHPGGPARFGRGRSLSLHGGVNCFHKLSQREIMCVQPGAQQHCPCKGANLGNMHGVA